jgi:hypothetical protein
MPDQVTKIIFRRGTDATGRTITLNQGEPGFTTDTKRFYIGDGTTTFGLPVSIKNWGIKNFNTANFLNTFSGSEIGDIVYDDFGNHVYFLTAFPGTTKANWAKISFVVDVDDSTIEINPSSALQVKNFGIQSIHLNSNIIGNGLLGAAGSPVTVDVDNISIDILNNKLRVIPGAIPIDYLGSIDPFTVLGNTNNFSSQIEDIPVGNGQVVGRLGNTLGGIDFDQIVANGGAVAAVTVSSPITAAIDTSVFPNTLRIGLDSGILTIGNNFINLGTTTEIDGLLTVNGNLRVTGDIVAFYSSDLELKKDIKEIESSLDKLNEIRGVEFTWKKSNEKDVGVIAQEVEKVLPLIVATRQDGYKAVRYEKIIPLLINSIKELSAEVKSLKEQLKK